MNVKFRGGFVIIGMLLAGSSGWAQKTRTGGASVGANGDGRLIASIEGPALFKAYCASCHGADAKGNGPMAQSLKAAPADLTGISARNAGTFPLMRIERIISGEDQPSSGHGSQEMPVWGPIFSQVDQDRDLGRVRIDNLARYLREIQTK